MIEFALRYIWVDDEIVVSRSEQDEGERAPDGCGIYYTTPEEPFGRHLVDVHATDDATVEQARFVAAAVKAELESQAQGLGEDGVRELVEDCREFELNVCPTSYT